jgi:hypothetical protein
MNTIHKSDKECNVHREPKSRVIDDYAPIYAILDFLNNIGYSLKKDENDYSYNGILPKIHDEIEDFYSDRHNLPIEKE